jgi:hypothetical protein
MVTLEVADVWEAWLLLLVVVLLLLVLLHPAAATAHASTAHTAAATGMARRRWPELVSTITVLEPLSSRI